MYFFPFIFDMKFKAPSYRYEYYSGIRNILLLFFFRTNRLLQLKLRFVALINGSHMYIVRVGHSVMKEGHLEVITVKICL